MKIFITRGIIELHNGMSINIECPAKINEIQMKRYKG